MKELYSNGFASSIAQAIEEMKGEQGDGFSLDRINLAELERRSGVSHGNCGGSSETDFRICLAVQKAENTLPQSSVATPASSAACSGRVSRTLRSYWIPPCLLFAPVRVRHETMWIFTNFAMRAI